MFRPSDDATIYAYLIPSNFFAVISLRQAAEMVKAISKDNSLAAELDALAHEVDAALKNMPLQHIRLLVRSMLLK